jgi:hypothetical protein
MRLISKITAALAVLALFLPVATFAADLPPTIPLLVYGDVSLYGVTPPAGAEVSVSNGDAIIATTTVNSVGKYFFQIPASYTGLLLTYKIGNLVVVEKVALNPAQHASDHIDLIVVASAPAGGGGGGGGGSYIPPTSSPLSAEAQKVDTNKDNKIDVLDFNALMVNWGNIASNNIADFNADNKVDIFDFNYLMIYWS